MKSLLCNRGLAAGLKGQVRKAKIISHAYSSYHKQTQGRQTVKQLNRRSAGRLNSRTAGTAASRTVNEIAP